MFITLNLESDNKSFVKYFLVKSFLLGRGFDSSQWL